MMLTSIRLQVAKFHMGGLMNRPQGNSLVKLSSSFRELNITNGFLSYIKELNISHIKFNNAIKRYAMFKSQETINRGIFDDITSDVIIVTLLIVFAVIIIIFTYYFRKYSMNEACFRNAKIQKSVNAKIQKSVNVKIQKSENECVTQGSVEPQDVPRDAPRDVKDGVKPVKVITCGSCGVTPLCCLGCSEQTILPSNDMNDDE